MAVETRNHRYRPTVSQFKGGVDEMYVIYDMDQKSRGGGHAIYPKVRRVYIAGDVQSWTVGEVKKRSGRLVYSVTVSDHIGRRGLPAQGVYGQSGPDQLQGSPASVKASSQIIRKIVEVPRDAQNVHFYQDMKRLPEKYRQAFQDVR